MAIFDRIETYDVFVQQLVESVRYVDDWAFVSNVFG